VIGTGVHAVMGTGGAPEGVLCAAALRCLNGQILARLVVSKPEHSERMDKMGIKDHKRIYDTDELAPGKYIIFACTGVTEGSILRGVRFFGEGIRTHSLILTLDQRQVRFVDTVHLYKRPDVKVRFA
jgi:fructose-1,6-bisphosphatase II